MLSFSERLQRTKRTFRLLPLPRFVSPATTPSLQKTACRDGKCMPSLSFEKTSGLRLEVETNLRRQGSWGHVVSPAERRQKVIERVLVRDVHGLQAQAPSVIVAFE